MNDEHKGAPTRPTQEVGDEGGTPGDVELEGESIVTGSEATSTVDSAKEPKREIRRGRDGGGPTQPLRTPPSEVRAWQLHQAP